MKETKIKKNIFTIRDLKKHLIYFIREKILKNI